MGDMCPPQWAFRRIHMPARSRCILVRLAARLERIWPRGAIPENPLVPPLQRDIPQAPPLYPRFVPLTLAQCASPWSRATKLTPTEFRRRCASMLKHQEELKRQEERRSFRE